MKWTSWNWLFVAMGVMTGVCHADILAFENMEGAVPGALSGQDTGIGFTGAISLPTNAKAVVTNMPLSYAQGDVSSTGGAQSLFVGYPNWIGSRAIGSQTQDVLYLGFLFQTPTASGPNDDFISFGFANQANETTAGVVHRSNQAWNDRGYHGFGLRVSGKDYFPADTATELNETYLVVLRLRKLTPGAANKFNEISFYVNPSSVYEAGSEPALVMTNDFWVAATHLGLRVANLETTDGYFIDNICVGETWDDVVFPQGSPVVKTPQMAPVAGTYSEPIDVTLSSATAGATIYYTTDGSVPTPESGILYTGPFTLSATTVVTARAYKDGMFASALSTTEYRFMMHWVGAGGDDEWSTAANWYLPGDPAGKDILFESVDLVKNKNTVNNVIRDNLTVGSLMYTNVVNDVYHVTQIDPGATLTVNGATRPVESFRVGAPFSNNKNTRMTMVQMVGGGALVVDTPTSDLMISTLSKDNVGIAILDAGGLSSFEATVKEFVLGRGDRSSGQFTLALTNRIEADRIFIADSHGSDAGDSMLRLGRVNEFYTDTIYVGAGPGDYEQGGKGYILFQDAVKGEPKPTVKIRTKDGESGPNLTLGFLSASPNKMNNRTITSSIDLTGGIADVKLGDVLIAQHQAAVSSGKTGGTTAWFTMDDGLVEAQKVTLGRTIKRSGDTANPAMGTLHVLGGTFRAASMLLGENIAASDQNMGRPYGIVNVAGDGLLEVAGDVTLGKLIGQAPEVFAQVNVSNGTLRVAGSMEPDAAYVDKIRSEVHLVDGRLEVTNALGTGTLRIENGLLHVAGGEAIVDTLVTTNALCETEVCIGPAGTGCITARESVALGGSLDVVCDEGFEPLPGTLWPIVTGTGTREGTFEETRLPEGFLIQYTAHGYNVLFPGEATLLLVR